MADSDKNIRITTSKNKTTPPKIVFTGSSAGSSVITLEVLDDNTLSFTSNEGQIFSLDSNLSTGTIWSVNDISGYPLLRADVGAASGTTIRIAEGLGTVGIGETNPIHKFNVKGALAIGSTNTANYTVFRFPAAGSGQTYILPSAYPGTGTSILQSDTTGNLLWVAAAAGAGGGSGVTSANVNATLATTAAVHRVLFTPATTTVAGAALSLDTVLSYNPSTDLLTTFGLEVTATSGTAVSISSDVDLRTAKSMKFFNSGNTFFTGLKAGANAASYTLTLPTAAVGVGYSTILVDTSGNMFFVPAEGGLAFTSATGNRPVLRQKQHHHIWFSSGYTPLAAGPDNVIFQIPDLYIDGTSDITYGLEAFYIRVETPSAGSSRVQVERSSTRTGAFTLAGTGSSLISGFGLTIAGAGIYVTDTSVFGAGIFVTSGDLLRLNWTLLNATHANFSVQLTLAEI
jgi:hypothetical protein